MKILCVGDLHMRYELPYSSSIKDGRKKEWENVKKTILDSAKECDAVVLLGDCFNLRHNHSSVIKEFVDFLNGFGDKDIHILAGNHERYNLLTALDFLRSVNKKNIHVYTEPTQIKIGDKTAMMIPFVTPALLAANSIVDGYASLKKQLVASDMAFCHLAISGAKSTEFFNEIILDKKELSKLFGITYAGHLHKYEKLEDNVYITGAVFTSEIGELDTRIFILDTKTMKHKEVMLPVRGIRKLIWETRDVGEVIPKETIVKCYVTKRETDLEEVKKALKYFDAAVVIEQYDNERTKAHFDEGSLDLSIDSLLKMYADAKKLSYIELKEGFDLLK